MTAAQGIDFRAPLKTSEALSAAHAAIRQAVPDLEEDRYLAPDLERAIELVRSGALNASIPENILPELRSEV